MANSKGPCREIFYLRIFLWRSYLFPWFMPPRRFKNGFEFAELFKFKVVPWWPPPPVIRSRVPHAYHHVLHRHRQARLLSCSPGFESSFSPAHSWLQISWWVATLNGTWLRADLCEGQQRRKLWKMNRCFAKNIYCKEKKMFYISMHRSKHVCIYAHAVSKDSDKRSYIFTTNWANIKGGLQD